MISSDGTCNVKGGGGGGALEGGLIPRAICRMGGSSR